MKNSFLILSFLLVSILSNAQDKILTLTKANDTISCKVASYTDTCIYYRITGDTTLKKIPNSIVHKIIFSDGEKLFFRNKVNVTSAKDWEKVLVIYSESQLDGLVKLDQITEKYSLGLKFNIGSDERMKKNAITQMRRDVAEKGIPILYINSQVSYYQYSGGTYAVINGITFDYPESLNSLAANKPRWNKFKGAMR